MARKICMFETKEECVKFICHCFGPPWSIQNYGCWTRFDTKFLRVRRLGFERAWCWNEFKYRTESLWGKPEHVDGAIWRFLFHFLPLSLSLSLSISIPFFLYSQPRLRLFTLAHHSSESTRCVTEMAPFIFSRLTFAVWHLIKQTHVLT